MILFCNFRPTLVRLFEIVFGFKDVPKPELAEYVEELTKDDLDLIQESLGKRPRDRLDDDIDEVCPRMYQELF